MTAIRVLIVEDDLILRQMYKVVLNDSKHRFDVVYASTGKAAIEALDTGPFECVLLDYMLPDISGLEVLAAIREHTPSLPVIVATGAGNAKLQAQFLEAGATSYLTKGGYNPVRLPDILMNVAKMPAQSAHVRLLLVDEDPRVWEALVRAVDDDLVKVERVQNGLEAVSRLTEPYSIVMADPLAWGDSTIGMIRSVERVCPGAEVIVVTDDTRIEEAMAATEYGAIGYIVKPFDDNSGLKQMIDIAVTAWADALRNDELYQSVIDGTLDTLMVNGKPYTVPFFREGFPVLALTSLLNDGLVFLGDDGGVSFATPRFARTLRLPYLDLFGKQFEQLVYFKDRHDFGKLFEQAKKERSTLARQLRFESGNGQIVSALITCRGFTTRHHQVELAMVISDLSGTRQLQQRMDMLVDLVEHARFEAILVHNERGEIIRLNRASQELFGDPKRQLLGCKVNELLLDTGDLNGPHEEVLEATGVRADGSAFPVEIVAGHDDASVGILFIRDISERKKSEEKLRRSEANFRALIEHSLDPVMVVTKGRFIYGNPASVSYLGYKDFKQIKGVDVSAILRLDECEETDKVERIFKHRNGKELVAELVMLPIIFDGQPARLIVARDITKRKQEEEELRRNNERLAQIQQAQGQYMANMSHELKTPINAIMGYASLMLDDIGGQVSDKQRKWLGSVKSQSGRLLRIIQEILDFAKLEAGKLTMNPRKIDLQALCRDLKESAQALTKDKDVEIIVQVMPDVGDLVVDLDRLRQVLLNLLGNASKFTQQGEISLKVRAIKPQMVQFIVKDTGVGIEQDDLLRIFDDFYQADGTSTRAHGGTGLGLSIVKKLVTLMGGEVDVVSEVGFGSSFSVILPVLPLKK